MVKDGNKRITNDQLEKKIRLKFSRCVNRDVAIDLSAGAHAQ